MKLVTYTRVNQEYFDKKSRPSRLAWKEAVENGTISGKILLNQVYIDIDDFLSRDEFTEPSANDEALSIAERAQQLFE